MKSPLSSLSTKDINFNLIHDFFNYPSLLLRRLQNLNRLPYIATLRMQNYIPIPIENNSHCNYNGFRDWNFHFRFKSHNILKEEILL
ncbi:hypothetical protein C6A34_03325 [Bacillus thuringiensis]|nr:hypothetical protein C6A34_03325 [Bacillus thuringiensis]